MRQNLMRQNLMPSIVLSDRTLSRSTDSAFELLVVEVMAVWFRFALVLDRLCRAMERDGLSSDNGSTQ
jgi:hypothetical protein